MDQPLVVGYSERGMVNELVYYFRSNSSDIPAFLKSIEWNGQETVSIINKELLENPTDFQWIVEPGFAQFGDPDLILVCRPKAAPQRTHLFFIEAKIVTYSKSSMSNEDGMETKGYNSSINGQLSLRYRLSLAIADYKVENNEALKEPVKVTSFYQHRVKDQCKHSRKLEKQRNLKHLLPLVLDAQTTEMEEKQDTRCFFIALTADERRPFDLDNTAEGEEYSPLYCTGINEKNNDTAAWKRTGWIGWESLENHLSEGYKNGVEYCATKKLAIERKLKTKANSGIGTNIPVGISKWSLNTKLREEIKIFLADHCSGYSGQVHHRYIEGTGSDSVSVNGIVLIKILPPGKIKGKTIVLALASDLGTPVEPPFEMAFQIGRRQFVGVEVFSQGDLEMKSKLSKSLATYLGDRCSGK